MNIKEELQIKGEYPAFFGPGTPKYNTPVSPLENIRLATKRDADGNLKGEQVWAPQGGDMITFCPIIYPDVIARGFAIEKSILPPEQFGGKDMLGIEWEWVPAVSGSMVRPGSEPFHDEPEEFAEWEKYIGKEINGTTMVWPDVNSWDWEGSVKANADIVATAGERPVMPWIFTGYFERLISLMNFQNAAVAMIDEDAEDAIHRLFDKLTDLYLEIFAKFKQYYGATAVYFHDDWGSQQKAFLKYETYDEMIVPHLKRLCDGAHELGMIVVLHSCGKIENLVPLMVKAHVDVWSGQAMNDRLAVVKANKGKIYVEFGPDVGGAFSAPIPEEEQIQKIDEWLDTFGDYLDTIFVNTSFGGNQLLYSKIYEYSRKKFNR